VTTLARLSPSPALSRTLAVSILVVLVFLFGSAVAGIDGIWKDHEARIERSLRLLAGYQALVRTRPGMEEQLKELSGSLGEFGLLDAASPPLVAARIQTDIKRIIETHGGALRSVQVLPTSSVSGLDVIGLRVDLVTPLAGLQRIIFELETMTPRLFLENISFRAPEVLPPERPPELSIRLDVIGYTRGGAS
jgi:hypothetical protein